jgi:hypothetical protein
MTTDVDLVNTQTAARLYGCKSNSLTSAMRRAGVSPEVRMRPHPHGGGCRTYWWHPLDVLRVRAERKLRQVQAQLAFKHRKRPKDGTKRANRSRVLAIQGRAEFERRKILQRVAARKGVSVEQLVQEKGIQRYYREA